MIIRIIGEGKFDVPDHAVPPLDRLYRNTADATPSGDADAFARSLSVLLAELRTQGSYLGKERLHDVDALLPPKDSTLENARVFEHLITQLHAGIVPG